MDTLDKWYLVTRGEYKGKLVLPIAPDWKAGMMLCETKDGVRVLIPYDGYKDA